VNILSLESSATACSAALCRDGALVAQFFQNSGLTHSRTLLPMVHDMLKNCGETLDQVDVIAVASGPGSFTGLRIGISAKIDQLHATAGYLISNLDIYSQYRHLRYRGESFEQFYPVISSMQGAFISLSYEF